MTKLAKGQIILKEDMNVVQEQLNVTEQQASRKRGGICSSGQWGDRFLVSCTVPAHDSWCTLTSERIHFMRDREGSREERREVKEPWAPEDKEGQACESTTMGPAGWLTCPMGSWDPHRSQGSVAPWCTLNGKTAAWWHMCKPMKATALPWEEVSFPLTLCHRCFVGY